MTPPPTNIDGTDITGATIDGTDVTEITVDGDTVFAALLIPDSGVSRWTFDDVNTSGSTATDVWGNNDGTINGATTGVSGANQTYTTNEAYSFDGTDDVVTVSHDTSLDITGDISVAVWTYWDGGNDSFQTIQHKRPNYSLAYNRTNLYFEIDGTNSADRYEFNSGPTQGQWEHLVVTLGGSTLKLYRDGAETASVSADTLDSTDTTDLAIGNFPDQSNPWNGDLDDLRLYDKALSSTEVSNLYNNGSI